LFKDATKGVHTRKIRASNIEPSRICLQAIRKSFCGKGQTMTTQKVKRNRIEQQQFSLRRKTPRRGYKGSCWKAGGHISYRKVHVPSRTPERRT